MKRPKNLRIGDTCWSIGDQQEWVKASVKDIVITDNSAEVHVKSEYGTFIVSEEKFNNQFTVKPPVRIQAAFLVGQLAAIIVVAALAVSTLTLLGYILAKGFQLYK